MKTLRQNVARIAVGVIGVLAVQIIGCDGSLLSGSGNTDVSSYSLTLVDGNRLSVIRSHASSRELAQLAMDSLSNPDSTAEYADPFVYDVAEIDLATLAVTITQTGTTDAEAAFAASSESYGDSNVYWDGGNQTVSDGTWSVALRSDDTVIATRTDTGAQMALDVGVAHDMLSLIGVRNGRAVLEVDTFGVYPDIPEGDEYPADYGPTTPPSATFIIFELATGERWTVELGETTRTGSAAVLGDELVYFAVTQTFDFTSADYPTPRLWAINLATRVQREIAAGIAGDFGGFSVTNDSQMIWQQVDYSEGPADDPEAISSSVSIWSYDATTDATAKLAEYVGETGEMAYVTAMNDRAAFVSATTYINMPVLDREPTSIADFAALAEIEIRSRLILLPFGGSPVTLLEQTEKGFGAIGLGFQIGSGALTDDYAAAADSTTGELIVYTLATGEVRKTAIFGSE